MSKCILLDDRSELVHKPNSGRGSHELRHSIYCSNSKSYYEIFSTTTLDYWKNYHDSFGVTHAQYELRGLLWFRFGGADSIENNDDIGYRNIYHDSFAVTHVFSQVYYSSFLKK